jgi:hypothetical protein
MANEEKARANSHVQIVVSEGKVTLEELHAALDLAIKEIVHGGCNCGLTGFDVSFVRGDPGLTKLNTIHNIVGGVVTRG